MRYNYCFLVSIVTLAVDILVLSGYWRQVQLTLCFENTPLFCSLQYCLSAHCLSQKLHSLLSSFPAEINLGKWDEIGKAKPPSPEYILYP